MGRPLPADVHGHPRPCRMQRSLCSTRCAGERTGCAGTTLHTRSRTRTRSCSGGCTGSRRSIWRTSTARRCAAPYRRAPRACNSVRAFACVRCMRGAKHRRLDVITISSPNPMRTPKRTVVITARVTNHRPPRLSPLRATCWGRSRDAMCTHAPGRAHTFACAHTHSTRAIGQAGRHGLRGGLWPSGIGQGRSDGLPPSDRSSGFALRCTRASRRPRSCAKVLCCLRKTSDLTASYNHQSQTRNSGRARRVSHLRRPAGVRPARSTHLQGPVTASHIAPLSRLVWLWPRRPPARPRGRFHVGACAFRAASVD